MIDTEQSKRVCGWCETSVGDDAARWEVGAFEAFGSSQPASTRWSCPSCTPLVEGRELMKLATRARIVARKSGRGAARDSFFSSGDLRDVFAAVDAALVRPSPEARQAWALASAEAGTNTIGGA